MVYLSIDLRRNMYGCVSMCVCTYVFLFVDMWMRFHFECKSLGENLVKV